MSSALGLQLLLAAARQAAHLREAEATNQGKPFGEFWGDVLHPALGVATLSVASLEAYANEHYFEGRSLPPGFDAAANAELLAIIDGAPVLAKFSMLIAFRTGKGLDRGKAPAQDVDDLIQLRNAVVHFRPSWYGEAGQHTKLSRRLAHRFQPSPFLPQEQLFPQAWASSSFGDWAIRSVVTFLDEFHRLAGLDNRLQMFRDRIEAAFGQRV